MKPFVDLMSWEERKHAQSVGEAAYDRWWAKFGEQWTELTEGLSIGSLVSEYGEYRAAFEIHKHSQKENAYEEMEIARQLGNILFDLINERLRKARDILR